MASTASNTFTYIVSICIGILAAIYTIVVYTVQTPNRLLVLAAGMAVIVVVAFLSNIGLQKATGACRAVAPASAALGSVWSGAGYLAFVLLAQLEWVRVPIASAFAPLFGAVPNLPLDAQEAGNSLFQGVSVAYYAFFGSLMGALYGAQYALDC